MILIIGKIKGVIDSERPTILDKQQKEWQEYARSRSAYVADKFRYGSASGIEFNVAYIEECVKRIHELEEMYWQEIYGN